MNSEFTEILNEIFEDEFKAYEIKNSMTLRLFERLDDDNYYRAFPLVERRRGNDY